jgi:hypothetical protein
MTEPVKSELELRLVQLERRLGFLRAALTAVVMAVVVGVMFFSLHSHFSSTQSNGVLRVKGLIVEDGEGRERILIGAPVPVVSGRKRRDGAVGLLVLGENGADRIAIGAPYPDPQSQGKVSDRIGRGAGLVFDDANGDERGGFGVMDNDGRATFGLDYPHGTGEAITLGVLPGETALSIHDSKTMIRASLVERNDAAPLLFGLDPKGTATSDISILRLNPYRIRHVVIASDEALNKALEDADR